VPRFDPDLKHFEIIYNGDFRSSELHNIETPESWRKTPISSEMFGVENFKLLEKPVAI
jgi:hypothetical protein